MRTTPVTGHPAERAAGFSETVFAVFALLMLLAAQWLLSGAIHGTNYYGGDGKMAQATVLATLKFGGLFQVTNISPIQGVGSQLLPMNVWANPAYWPFAFFDKETATDVSALVALACFMVACYVMARCFDVPVVPSAVAAQLCIMLFAPALLIFLMPTVFCLTPGNAVAYAPYMIALGLLGRLEPGSRSFGWITTSIFVLLLYSLYCDPLWSAVNGFSWAVPFAVVTFGALERRTILLRCAALGCSFALLLLSGAAGYLYSLSQYTARVQFAAALDRARELNLVSAVSYASDMKYFYLACAAGWLLGLASLRGRPRLLVATASISFCVFLAYSVVYLLLLNAVWVPPIPIYVEQCLCSLFIAGAAAGYWGALRTAAPFGRRSAAALVRYVRDFPRLTAPASTLSRVHVADATTHSSLRSVTMALAVVAVAVVPARITYYAIYQSGPKAKIYDLPWPNEPELGQFLSDRIGLAAGRQFRGSLDIWDFDLSLLADLWTRGIHTIHEYSQLVTPQGLYVAHVLLNQQGGLNWFLPNRATPWDTYSKVMQLFGARYYLVLNGPSAPAEKAGYSLSTMPHHQGQAPGLWYVYEFPRPNMGDYSPTEVVTAGAGTEIMAAIGAPGFDFTKQVVLTARLSEPLVPALDMRLSVIRGGLHVSGKSHGTSLVVLPQQFSHCLRARDGRVRFVRANLLMAGMIFSGDIDSDILFDYGIFSPGCRRADIADMKHLDLKIDFRRPHLSGDRLFPDWDGVLARLGAAAKAIR